MNISKNSYYYIFGIFLFVLLKFGFKQSNLEDLSFLLKPTDLLLSAMTASSSEYIEDIGYYHQKLDIIIDKSCAGFNLWTILFLMLLYVFIQHSRTHLLKMIAFPLILLFSLVITVFVNTSRIFVSIISQNTLSEMLHLETHVIHEGLGILINLSFLILTYLITDTLIKKYMHNAQLTKS
ncbi:exosortase K [Aquimarina litoralis]|uniref:exosortase K n=1 Tax=Aquimarina litoralis TaxID=584605 RepID=UPI001C56060E|nr:exosortase K [Aquimarina litoralis]MBW1294928.1 exosortase K [Aquimarina litoralis]